MARRRFFVPQIRRGVAELTGVEAEHLTRVLRAEAGQVYEICDNQDVYLAEIVTARKSLVSFNCLEKLPMPPAGVSIALLPALIKFDRFEWLIEKATELGVQTIQPFEAVRTEHGLFEASKKRIARWQKIGVEASQQSRRWRLPDIRPSIRFTQALRDESTIKLFLDEEPRTISIADRLPAQRQPDDRVALLVGPEGGWTDDERTQAAAAGWLSGSLGPQILRTETAAIAALAVIQSAWRLNGAQS